jgi:hypothetical protein
MPKHPKRPRDPAQLAKLIVDIATGEVTDDRPAELTRAQEFARKGGNASERRSTGLKATPILATSARPMRSGATLRFGCTIGASPA